MTSKTWFLPPDFTFLPDGQISLGRIIPKPRQPTVTLASLADFPTLALPEVKSIVEKNRGFLTEKKKSFGLELLSKFLDIASAGAGIDLSWYKNKSFSAVDHEVRVYNGPFTPEILKAVVESAEVKRHIRQGRFSRRYVYIVTGLRTAQQSFTVTDEKGSSNAASLSGSGPVPAGMVPFELTGSVSASREDNRVNGYETAPGIVFAYRLHVIRPKEAGGESELFSAPTAFCSGEAEDDEDEEMEVVEVNEAVLHQDLDLRPGSYEARKSETEEGEGSSYVVFKSSN